MQNDPSTSKIAAEAARLAELPDDQLIAKIKEDMPEELPADMSPNKNVIEKLPKNVVKRIQHRKMRRLGMGKHVAGNAKSLANHSRVPGEVTVGQNKTKAQYQAEQRATKKRKNKMARKSRARNRR